MADLYSDIAVGDAKIQGVTLSFEANAAITKGQAVKYVAVASALPKVDVAGAGEKAIGIAAKTVAQGEQCPVYMSGSVVKVTFGGAITTGQRVQSGATGKVVASVPDAPATYGEATMQTELDKLHNAFGKALQSPTADGDTGLILVE